MMRRSVLVLATMAALASADIAVLTKLAMPIIPGGSAETGIISELGAAVPLGVTALFGGP